MVGTLEKDVGSTFLYAPLDAAPIGAYTSVTSLIEVSAEAPGYDPANLRSHEDAFLRRANGEKWLSIPRISQRDGRQTGALVNRESSVSALTSVRELVGLRVVPGACCGGSEAGDSQPDDRA